MQSPYITAIDTTNIQQVIEMSMQTPVLIHFWASMSQESVELLTPLNQLVNEYQGAFHLATLDCEKEQAIAGQFGVQALPTLALFVNGQPVDGMGGPQPIEAIKQMLAKHLPSQDELALKEALTLMTSGEHAKALTVMQSLDAELQQKGEVKLAMTECLIETQQIEQAKALLDTVPMQFHDNHYKGLQAKLELFEQAANSPELQALEQQQQATPDDLSLCIELAAQYHQVNRSEDALELLWQVLVKDLGAHDGEIKKSFMDIMSALGQESSVAKAYRRKLYSILY